MTVRFHPDARLELRDALSWYEERSPVSATAFAQEVEDAVLRILDAPTRYPQADHGTRRVLLDRFPFNVFYRCDDTGILIVAVAHQKRRPGYWRTRTSRG